MSKWIDKLLSETPEAAAEAKKKKNVAYRLLAALIALLCIGVFALPLRVILMRGNGAYYLEKLYFFTTFQRLFESDSKILGFLPTLSDSGMVAYIATIPYYLLVLALVTTFFVSFIAIFTAKASPTLVRIAVFTFTWATAIYSIGILIITAHLTSIRISLDLWMTIVALVGAGLYFILMLAKVGNAAWAKAIQFALTLIASVSILLSLTQNTYLIQKSATWYQFTCKVLMWVAIGITLVNLFSSTLISISKKAAYAELLRIIVQTGISIAIVCLDYVADMNNPKFIFFALVAAIISLLQLLIVALQIVAYNRRKLQEETKLFLQTFEREEYVEVIPYDGGPVAGVRMAKEVVGSPIENPNVQVVKAAGYTAPRTREMGYDFYNRSFDPFISGLSPQERAEFVDLYIIKCRGDMPEIPDYEVGGKNKEFFDKVFICLGQYREKIPSGLLSKMYDHSMKLK